MITLNDYLYNGDTVLRILQRYAEDLKKNIKVSGNETDYAHIQFLHQISDMLEHNDFLTAQSQKLRDFYKFLAQKYPFLAFTFRGRIKSLIRAEQKFNGYIIEFVNEYYRKNKEFPSVEDMKEKLNCFRDLIAYRIVISMPKCHLRTESSRRTVELYYLYDIANELPKFLEERGFTPEETNGQLRSKSTMLNENVRDYYRDYISSYTASGYESLHVTFFDNTSRSYFEVQLRTKEMDDYAEIGPANHIGYEKKQELARSNTIDIPVGQCMYYDQACERIKLLNELDLAEVDVNMFAAVNNTLINDSCGLFRGRQILPYEHLSRFQNDMID